jgi:hypothetical protein
VAGLHVIGRRDHSSQQPPSPDDLARQVRTANGTGALTITNAMTGEPPASGCVVRRRVPHLTTVASCHRSPPARGCHQEAGASGAYVIGCRNGLITSQPCVPKITGFRPPSISPSVHSSERLARPKPIPRTRVRVAGDPTRWCRADRLTSALAPAVLVSDLVKLCF